MIKKPQFLNMIKDGEFDELFISELGWDRYKGRASLPTVSVDGTDYRFKTIADRSGFQILTCEVDEIPTQSLARKLDTRIRRQANDYICIFRKKGTAHDLWMVPVRANEKRDLVMVEYDQGRAEVIWQKIDGITFSFDEQTNIVDLRAKVQGAFAVNSEKMTKDFYSGFKKEHNVFAELIMGIDDHIDVKKNKNKQWYASVMLNRLMFCYFIQKKGFLNLDTDYLRHKLEMVQSEEGSDSFYNFYRSFLRVLFHDGLNSPKHESICNFYGRSYNNAVYYRAAGGGYFLLVKPTKSITYINGQLEDVKAEKQISIEDTFSNINIASLLSSSLFYWNYIGYTDCRNLTKSFIDKFPCPLNLAQDQSLACIGKMLYDDYEQNCYEKDTYYKTTGRNVVYYEYYPKLSKSKIDLIDLNIAQHYGFTDEELDFIINYDIKYRMGDELE